MARFAASRAAFCGVVVRKLWAGSLAPCRTRLLARGCSVPPAIRRGARHPRASCVTCHVLPCAPQIDSRKANAWRTRVGTSHRDRITKSQFLGPEHEKDLYGKHSPAPNLYDPTHGLTKVSRHHRHCRRPPRRPAVLSGGCNSRDPTWRLVGARAAGAARRQTGAGPLASCCCCADVARHDAAELPLWVRRPLLPGEQRADPELTKGGAAALARATWTRADRCVTAPHPPARCRSSPVSPPASCRASPRQAQARTSSEPPKGACLWRPHETVGPPPLLHFLPLRSRFSFSVEAALVVAW